MTLQAGDDADGPQSTPVRVCSGITPEPGLYSLAGPGKRQQLDRSQWMMSFTAPDGRTLQWVLRSQLGKGPLALLDLRGFTLPDQIFSVDSAATAQALMATANSDMEEVEE